MKCSWINNYLDEIDTMSNIIFQLNMWHCNLEYLDEIDEYSSNVHISSNATYLDEIDMWIHWCMSNMGILTMK
jgi:hypothetical protein